MNFVIHKMYVRWREREHGDMDYLFVEYPVVVTTLKKCRLWKFSQCPLMRAQPRLLNALVYYWHPDAEAFMLEG